MELIRIFQTHCEFSCQTLFPTELESAALSGCREACLPSAAVHFLSHSNFDRLSQIDGHEKKELSAKLLTGENLVTTNCTIVNKLWLSFVQLIDKFKNNTLIYQTEAEFAPNVVAGRAFNNLNHAHAALGCGDAKKNRTFQKTEL